jgi:hypothetical protein
MFQRARWPSHFPSRFRLRCATAACLLALCVAAPARAHHALLLEARQAYYQGQYSRSLALFEQLAARRGNKPADSAEAAEAAEAAECAAFMLLHGDRLYGAQVRRDIERAKHLLVQAASAGRAGAAFTLNMLDASD